MNDIDDKYGKTTTKQHIEWIWDSVYRLNIDLNSIKVAVEDSAKTNKEMLGIIADNVTKLLMLIAFLLALILWRIW